MFWIKFYQKGYDTYMQKSLEQYLKELRKSCGYSQEFVASHLNITRQTYSHYETGRITPPVNSLYNLAKLYGIAVEDLMERIVTYNINDDFIKNPSPESALASWEDLTPFLEYINSPEQNKKFKNLNRNEKFFLYYYEQLDQRDQQDIFTFMKIKSLHNGKRDAK